MAEKKPAYAPPFIERIAPFFASSSAKMPAFIDSNQPRVRKQGLSAPTSFDSAHALPPQGGTPKKDS
jgi:hypothetical protein